MHKRNNFNKLIDECIEWTQGEIWDDSGMLAKIEQQQTRMAELEQRITELEAQVPKWISVDDELPEEKQLILMLDDCGGKYSGRGSALIATNEFDEPTIGIRMRYTHWMPFPQPSKEQDYE